MADKGGEQRPRAQMDLGGSASPRWSPLSNRLSEPSASTSHSQTENESETGPRNNTNIDRHHPDHPQPMPPRFPGDGLDYRRPASYSNFIDLTDEDAEPNPTRPQPTVRIPARPPRFGREIMGEIIDFTTDDAQETAGPPSPEIQFVYSRPIDAAARQPNQRPIELDAGDGEDDEVTFLRETRRRAAPIFPNELLQTMMNLPHLRAAVAERAQNARRHAERHRQATQNRFLNQAQAARNRANSNAAPRPPPRGARPHIQVAFIAPDPQYANVAFDMGLRHDEQPSSPEPTYEAPSKAPEGFTRSPQENDNLICPNCEDDLCVGDTDLKRQVWIVKACGHVRSFSPGRWIVNTNLRAGLLRRMHGQPVRQQE